LDYADDYIYMKSLQDMLCILCKGAEKTRRRMRGSCVELKQIFI